METNVSSEKVLESFSNKQVTFCDKSSILFYAAEEAVDSLNDNVIHTISNDNFPLLPEFSNMLQNSSTDSDAKYASDQYLGNLPEVTVVLEKLPEALVHKHTYSNEVIECCLMPNVPQNTDKADSLKSSLSHHKKITEPVMNQTTPILKKSKYPKRNLNVSIPFKEIVSEACLAVDAYSESSTGKASKSNKIVNNIKTISRKASRNLSSQHLDQKLDCIQQSSLQNSFAKLPSSKEIETSKFLGRNDTKGKENIKIVDSDASTCIVSKVNSSEVSFDKYPCIHLEKLNLGPYLYGTSSSSDCLQSKKDVPMDLQLEVRNAIDASGLFTEKSLPLNEELSPKTVNFSSPVTYTKDDSEEIYRIRSIDNLNEGPSGDDSVLFEHENSPKDISFLQTGSIVKDTNCNKSACSAVDVYSENSTRKVSELNKIVNNVKTISRKASRNLSGRRLDQNLDIIQQSSLQNSFAKLPSSKEIETSNYLAKNSTKGKKYIKNVDSNASTSIVKQVNHSEVSFDKYPVIHLEKLNLGPHLYGISNSSDCSLSKKDVPMDLQLEVRNAVDTSGLFTEKTLPLIEELSPKTVNFSPSVTDTKDDSEEIYRTRSIDNLNERPSCDDSVLFEHENSPKDISFLQTGSIVKDTNCNKSACSAVDVYSENSTHKVSKLNKIVNNVKTISRKASRNLSGRKVDQNLDFIQQSSLQNSFAKLPSSKEIETSNYLAKNDTEGKKNIKNVDSDASTSIVSQVNCSEVSFDKYPVIPLENLNLGPHLCGISSSSDCLQSKKDVPMNLQLEVRNDMNASGLSIEKTLPLIEELSPKTANFSPPVIDTKDDSTSSDVIFSEEICHTRSILKDLLTDNLNKVSSDDDSVLFDHENSPKNISFLQTESIVKDTNCNNSIPYKSAQNKFPIVLLERLNLPLSDSYTNYGMNSTESLHTNSVPAVTNVADLPIQIENVCSISRENFNKMQKRQNKSSNQSFRKQFNESCPSIIKPKSNYVSPFNISESSSDNTVADISISSSDDSLSENDLPLIMLSKQKLNLSHSFNLSEDSLTNDIPLISPKSNASLTLATKTKKSQVKSHKHKKKNSIQDTSDCSSSMKKKGSKSQMSCNISKKVKKKCNKSVELIPSEKKKNSKKSLRKKQMKVYKMITKYLEMQIKSAKNKNKSKKRENSKSIESVKLVSSNNGSDTESTLSSDSIELMYDSIEQEHSYAQNKNSFRKKGKTPVQCTCHAETPSISERIQEHNYAQIKNSFKKKCKTSAKKVCCCESSSTSKKDTKAKKRQKSIDKYRLGFLSNKFSLRYYNRFLASERLLLSKCKLKRNKKKEVKQLFNRLKAIGLMSLK